MGLTSSSVQIKRKVCLSTFRHRIPFINNSFCWSTVARKTDAVTIIITITPWILVILSIMYTRKQVEVGDTTRKIIRVYSQQTHRGIRPRRGIRGPFFSHSSSSQGIYRHLRYLSINNSTTTTDREKWDFAKSIVVAPC